MEPQGSIVTNQTILSTPSGTSFQIVNGSVTAGYVTTVYGGYNDATAAAEWGTYVTDAINTFKDKDGKVHVKRRKFTGKKVRGSKSGANNPSDRIRLLNPLVVYQYVKSRFRLLEQRKLDTRLEKIAKLMESARVAGQIAMAEKIQDRFGKLIREQEIIACGYNKAISTKTADAFMAACNPKIIKMTPLKNYVRLIPKNVQKAIEDVQQKKLFDNILVMHTDVNNTAVEKTREQKKDPILFGTIQESPDMLYYIIDWEDQWCDLTFSDLLKKMDISKKEAVFEESLEQAFLDTII